MTNDASGRVWELAARDYLQARGLEVLRQRYRCRLGELDLVCRDGATLVIVEVRARRRGSVVSALESVDSFKRRRIVRATRHLLMLNPQWHNLRVRFDVVTVSGIDSTAPELCWHRNAFESG